MRDYTNFERCNGEPCCVFAERICADNYKELLEKGKDSNGEEVFGEMLDDLLYLAELIDFMGITSCLAARGTLSERLTDKLTDSIAGLADEVLEKWENYQDKAALDGTWIQRFPVVKKRMNWISVREGVSISMKKGKQNIRRRVPQKPDIVEKLYWMRS